MDNHCLCIIKVVYTNVDCLSHQDFSELIAPSLERLEMLRVLLSPTLDKPKCRLESSVPENDYESMCALLPLGLMTLEQADALYQLLDDFVKLDKQMIPNASVEYHLQEIGGPSS